MKPKSNYVMAELGDAWSGGIVPQPAAPSFWDRLLTGIGVGIAQAAQPYPQGPPPGYQPAPGMPGYYVPPQPSILESMLPFLVIGGVAWYLLKK